MVEITLHTNIGIQKISPKTLTRLCISPSNKQAIKIDNPARKAAPSIKRFFAFLDFKNICTNKHKNDASIMYIE